MFDDPLDLGGELVEVEDGLAARLLLGFEEGVEAAFGVVFNGSHGARGIENNADVGVVFHEFTPCLSGGNTDKTEARIATIFLVNIHKLCLDLCQNVSYCLADTKKLH